MHAVGHFGSSSALDASMTYDTERVRKLPPSKSIQPHETAIRIYLASLALNDVFTAAEIGKFAGFDRIRLQRDAAIINLGRLYRSNPRMDVTPGVLILVTLLSDNRDGSCRYSQEHLGRILGRSRTAIAEAISRLKPQKLISQSSTNGQKSVLTPSIPKALLNSSNLNALVDGMRGKTCPVQPTGSDEIAAPTCPVQPTGPVPSTRQVEAKPVPSTRHTTTNRTLNHSKEVQSVQKAQKKSSRPQAEKTRLPEQWRPSEADREFARSKGLAEWQIDWVAESFIDYWRSPNAVRGGMNADWSMTWRNGVRGAIEKGKVPKERPAMILGQSQSSGRPGR